MSYAETFYLTAVVASLVMAARRPKRLARAGKWLLHFLAAGLIMGVLYYGLLAQHNKASAFSPGLIQWDALLFQTLALTGLFMILSGLDWLAGRGIGRLFHAATGAQGQPSPSWPARLGAGAGRIILFWLIGIPWIFTFVQTHRPKLNCFDMPDLSYSEIPPTFWRVAGRFYPAAKPTDTTVLLCHGIGDSQKGMDSFVEMFHRAGCAAITFDLPGQGQSGGYHTTFGVRESQAVAELARWARQRAIGLRPPRFRSSAAVKPTVIGFGVSLGSVALLLAAEDHPDLFDAIIVDSTFTNLNDMAEHLLTMLPRPLAWPIRHVGPWFLALEIGAPIRRVDTLRDIHKLDGTPKLFFHCRDDRTVPFDLGRKVFDAAGEPKEFVAFAEGDHAGGYFTDHRRYTQAILAILGHVATSTPE